MSRLWKTSPEYLRFGTSPYAIEDLGTLTEKEYRKKVSNGEKGLVLIKTYMEKYGVAFKEEDGLKESRKRHHHNFYPQNEEKGDRHDR